MKETIIMKETKTSTLFSVMTTPKGDKLYTDDEGNFYSTDKEAIKEGLSVDLFYGTPMDNLMALRVLVDIAAAGGWSKVKQL